ncbi:hypothetical protein FB45DRAFT_1063245 [Roridomyces roridus]|uniref:F-box domain-containing protein n=1 Tax=Roridomyces roridus TaxID=1738132 RepID=A0AAD7BEB0_9AGAR|nr:hypothetical protein FB45DRAFT_1063245 [Roridomyces roridus]
MPSSFDDDLSRPLDTPFSKTFLEGVKVVIEGECRIVDLDSAICHAKFELERMAHARVVIIQGQVARHKNATRAFRRLPPEIVGKILISAAPVSDADDIMESPWYLGHICHYWRERALPTSRDAALPVLERPLKVLYWSASKPDPRLLRMLVERSERWTFASHLLNPHNFGEIAPIRGRIPQLRHLRIEVVTFWPPGATSKTQSQPFEIAPALRDISFDDLSGLSYPLMFPWSQLTRLKGTGRLSKLLASLQRMPNLELVSLTLEGDLFATAPSTPITLPRLHLTLRTLRIMFCNPAHITQILTAVPTIETLAFQIMSSDKPDALLKNLTPRGGQDQQQPCLRPNIHSITVALDQGSFRPGQFMNMVESRWRIPAAVLAKGETPPCVRLRSVEILVFRDTECVEPVMQRLGALEHQGLKVSMLYGHEATDQFYDWRI